MDDDHLTAHDVASYVDRTASPGRQAGIVAHLARCADCRDEIADVSQVVAAPARGRRRALHVLLPAAAAAALLLVWTGAERMPRRDAVVHREEAVTLSAAPRLRAPLGAVAGPPVFVWTSVAYADRYRVRLHDRNGTNLWEHEGPDTTAAPPSSLVLAPGAYFWKVEAQTGFERWVSSDLAEFELRRPPPR